MYSLKEIHQRRQAIIEKQNCAISELEQVKFTDQGLYLVLKNKICDIYGPEIRALDREYAVAEYFIEQKKR